MQKIGILNSEIAKVLADMGHTDTIVIGDCGLPVPDGVKKIDLALKLGTPRFWKLLKNLPNIWKLKKSMLLPKCRAKTKNAGSRCTNCLTAKNGLLPTTNILSRPPKPLKQLYVPVKQHRLPM